MQAEEPRLTFLPDEPAAHSEEASAAAMPVVGVHRSVASAYRLAARQCHSRPLRCVTRLLCASAGVATAEALESAPMSAIETIDVSGMYVGNRQLMALFAVAARCPRLHTLALRSQQLYSADVLLAELRPAPEATDGGVSASRPCPAGRRRSSVSRAAAFPSAAALERVPTSGSEVLVSLAEALQGAEGYREDGLPLLIDLRDNAELGARAAREVQWLATACPFVAQVLLDGTAMDALSVDLVRIQCERNRLKLKGGKGSASRFADSA